MYQALYRKYRPMIFADVIGQSHITSTLKNEINSQRIAHAYLFSGSRGTGKTTCARIFAKGVNCPNVKDGDPCNTCAVCKGINDGSLIDVIEIDGASNTGVDNIRDIRDDVLYTPAVARFKVYIIDEVHMLSTGAYNALLKTLEDTPSHVIFILATTEAQKIAPTILSRCQRFDFRRLTMEDIAARLSVIAEMEGLTAEREALAQIASMADGAMRDAISILDQCATLGQDITLAHIFDTLGLCGEDALFALAQAIANNDAGDALTILDGLYARHTSFIHLFSALLELFRKVLISHFAADAKQILQCDAAYLESLKKLGDRLSAARVLYILRVLDQTLSSLPKSVHPRVSSEMCLFSLCDPTLCDDTSALVARIEQLEAQLATGAPNPAPAAKIDASSHQPQNRALTEESPIQPSDAAATKTVPVQEAPPPPSPSVQKQAMQAAGAPFLEWGQILKDLTSHLDFSFTSLLYDAKAHLEDVILYIICDHPLVPLRFADIETKNTVVACAAKRLSLPLSQVVFMTNKEWDERKHIVIKKKSDMFDDFLAQNADIITIIEE